MRQSGKIQPKKRHRLRPKDGRCSMYEKPKQAAPGRDFPETDSWGIHRKAVCKRCKCVIQDGEPSSHSGEFWHPQFDKEGKPHWCRNAGKLFRAQDMEIVPFIRKKQRRNLKRLGIAP